MKQCINFTSHWINARPKLKEWGWFFFLWLGGMAAFWIMAYPIKLLIKSL